MRAPVLRLELVEADVLRLRRGHQPHRHGHQSEADRSGPDGCGHRPRSALVARGLLPSQVVAPASKRGPGGAPEPEPSPTSRSRAGGCGSPTSTRSCTPRTASPKVRWSTTTPGSPRRCSPTSHDRPTTMVRLPDGVDRRAVLREALPGPPARAGSTPCPLDADSDIPACSIESVPGAGVDGQPRRARAAHAPGPRRRAVAALGDGVRPRPRPRHGSRRLRTRRPRAARPPRPARAARGGEDVGLEGLAPVGRHPAVGRRRDDEGLRARRWARCSSRATRSASPSPWRRTSAAGACSSTGARTTGTRRPCARTRCARTDIPGVSTPRRVGRAARARGVAAMSSAFAFTARGRAPAGRRATATSTPTASPATRTCPNSGDATRETAPRTLTGRRLPSRVDGFGRSGTTRHRAAAPVGG